MRATAWILDVTHRVRRFEHEVAPGVRTLAAVTEAAKRELGIELDLPIGVRGLDTAPELLFVLPGGVRDQTFTPLPVFAASDPRGFALYIEAMLGGWSPPTHELDVFYFGDTADLAAKLAHLVVKGVKRGTTGWIAALACEGVSVPKLGEVSIVTDRFGYALCAIRCERVELLRFCEINATHAGIEGEGDRTLEGWREGHLWYFPREAARLGLTFTEDAEVFFMHFRLLAVLGRPDDAPAGQS